MSSLPQLYFQFLFTLFPGLLQVMLGPKNSCFLGRPWRSSVKTLKENILINETREHSVNSTCNCTTSFQGHGMQRDHQARNKSIVWRAVRAGWKHRVRGEEVVGGRLDRLGRENVQNHTILFVICRSLQSSDMHSSDSLLIYENSICPTMRRRVPRVISIALSLRTPAHNCQRSVSILQPPLCWPRS